MCDDMLFKFQWQILRPWLEKECLGPGFVSVSPLRILIREIREIHLSKFNVISKYVALLINDLIIKTLTFFFFMIRKQNARKNETKKD